MGYYYFYCPNCKAEKITEMIVLDGGPVIEHTCERCGYCYAGYVAIWNKGLKDKEKLQEGISSYAQARLGLGS